MDPTEFCVTYTPKETLQYVQKGLLVKVRVVTRFAEEFERGLGVARR